MTTHFLALAVTTLCALNFAFAEGTTTAPQAPKIPVPTKKPEQTPGTYRKVRLEGEHLKNMNVPLATPAPKIPSNLERRSFFKKAQAKCQEMGYKNALAFYYQRDTEKKALILTDAFCSNMPRKQPEISDARMLIIKDRMKRGAPVLPSPAQKALKKRAEKTEFSGYKTTDYAQKEETPAVTDVSVDKEMQK